MLCEKRNHSWLEYIWASGLKSDEEKKQNQYFVNLHKITVWFRVSTLTNVLHTNWTKVMRPAVDLCLPTASDTSFSLVLIYFDTVAAELL